jgi:hypothetical protein
MVLTGLLASHLKTETDTARSTKVSRDIQMVIVARRVQLTFCAAGAAHGRELLLRSEPPEKFANRICGALQEG